ncbi:helix-turn-helix domain-containing protein [Bacillus paramycoides]|uniref:helix-turn-helix domain-containing protein n=1 Tax=Bacillus paramycoides TaxID=2026194 RepID=UPI00399CF128
MIAKIGIYEKHAGMNYAMKLYEEGNRTVKQICEITSVSRFFLYRKIHDLK